MAESYSIKAVNILSELCFFILLLQYLYDIFYANKNRTIKLFKVVIEYISDIITIRNQNIIY